MAAMKQEKTAWMKTEKADVVPNAPGLMAQPYPPSVYVKEEMEDGGYEDFSEDPLRTEEAHLNMKQEPQLKLDVDGSQCNNTVPNTLLHTILEAESECCPPPLLVPKKELFPDDTLGISCLSDFIKEYPELNLEADETENIVVASTSYASNMKRFTGDMVESSDISYEEAFNQRVVNCNREIDSEDSTYFAMFFEEQERLFATRQKCSLTENIGHTFNCSFCLQSFSSKYRLIMHVFVHIDGVHPPRFVCKCCGEVFSSHASLNKHLKMSEVDQALSADKSEKFDFSGDHRSTFFQADQEEYEIERTRSQCSSKQTWKSSDIQFNETSNTRTVTYNAEIRNGHDNYGTSNTTGNFNAHTVLLPEKRRFKCVVSGESFTEVGSLKGNAIIHTGRHAHKCDICGKSFSRVGALKKHALIHTGTTYKCKICGRSYISLDSLNKHVLKHTGFTPHKCDVCGKSFVWLGSLNKHALIHTGPPPHKCDICGKSFIRLDHLQRHALIHTGMKPHRCDTCGKSFIRESGLKRHALIHTGMRPHKCDICGKSFILWDSLKLHTLIHTGRRSQKCDICGKSFTLLRYLKAHALLHTGTRPHKCNICEKSFTQLSTLKSHALLHTGTRPHKCNICEKSFTQLSTLKSHALKHTGIRPHKCNICEKSFSQSGALRKHALIHT